MKLSLGARKDKPATPQLPVVSGRKVFGLLPMRLQQMETLRLFIIAVVVAVLFLLIWAAVAKVDRVVRVEGKIIPAGHGQEIQHLEPGIIASIAAKEGDTVKRGDILLTIEDTAAAATLGETKSKLRSQTIKSLRLEAEAKGEDRLEFPADMANSPEAEAEQNLFQSRKTKLDQELIVHQSTIQHFSTQLTEASERMERLSDELTIARKRSAMVTALVASQAASKLELLEAQSREKQLATQLSSATDSVPTLKASIAEEEARLSTVKADFRSQAQTELVSVLSEIRLLDEALKAASDKVQRTEVRSPIDGTINRIAVNTVGGVIKPGDTLVEIIPNTSQILIEAKARPQDRGYLRPGLDANIRGSAYDVGEFGVLKGRVTEVSADTVQDPHGDPYYRVNILVDSVPRSYDGHPMVPGMTVTGDIVTGRRTVLRYLLSPLSKFSYQIFRDSR